MKLLFSVMDANLANGMTSQYVANRILQAVARQHSDIVVGALLHRTVVIVRTLWPSLFFWVMARRARKTEKLKSG